MTKLNMFSKSFFTILIFLKINFAFSQNCNCSSTLKILQEKIEANYAGYADKVTTKTSVKYKTSVSDLQQKAKSLSNDKDCQAILQAYIDFFEDPHLQLEDKYISTKVEVQTKQLPSENMFLYFQNLKLPENDLRGIWKSESYELAIINSDQPNWYDAIVLSSENKEWKKGMVKMRLKKINTKIYEIEYTRGDFETFATKGYFNENILDILSVGFFEKIEPKINQKLDIKTYKTIFPDEEVKFSFPNDSTAIIFISSFRNALEVVVDSLVLVNKQNLERRPYWIIDVSYNGGGGTGTYKALLPYINTSKIRRSGSYYRMSRENANKMEKFLNENKNLPPDVIEFFSRLVSSGKKKPDSWYFEKGSVFSFDKIEENPKKIGVLVSKKTMSSAEIFLMDAKQSKKVTIFGSQTGGVVDYGDGFIYTIGCDNIKVNIPSRKSEYLKHTKYDNIGLTPDVKIDDDNLMPYIFIMNYFNSKK